MHKNILEGQLICNVPEGGGWVIFLFPLPLFITMAETTTKKKKSPKKRCYLLYKHRKSSPLLSYDRWKTRYGKFVNEEKCKSRYAAAKKRRKLSHKAHSEGTKKKTKKTKKSAGGGKKTTTTTTVVTTTAAPRRSTRLRKKSS